MKLIIELIIMRPEGDDMSSKFRQLVVEEIEAQIENLYVDVKDEELTISEVTVRQP